MISPLLEKRFILQGSLLEFTQIFYLDRTGRKFELSDPIGRESHFLLIARALVKVLRGKTKRLIINVPPRYGKTELVIHFIAWALANYPDSNFLYISFSHSVAKKQTQTIREIVQLPTYRKLFDVNIKEDTSAKDNFELEQGGSIYAAGAGGTITSRGAGIKNCDRFGGCIVIDDIHKPMEVTSDIMRQSVNDWYYNTLQSRLNSPDTPIILIGQRLHEDDLPSNLIKTGEWETLILPALDESGNALHPQMHTAKELLKMKDKSPYEFAAQYQQDPQPSGGGIFKPEWFVLKDDEPEILHTFLTVDTAETDKDYNDATVFSFWGLYKINEAGADIDMYGLHWIDCEELRVEPKDLHGEFLQFYANCMRYKVKPRIIAIEKKSTGSTLLSVVKEMQGIQAVDVTRTKASGSKTSRFLEMQSYVGSKRISLMRYAKHTDMCIEHMRKITANNSHRWDDVCFVAGTKIATLYGSKNIEKMQIGDKVITPFGIGIVSNVICTGVHPVIKKLGLEGTPNHLVFTENGFISLDTVNDADKISTLSFMELLVWRMRKSLYLMERGIVAESRENIIEVLKDQTIANVFIESFMNFIVERKYRKAFMFIIRIMIDLITILIIWNCYHVANMLINIKNAFQKLMNWLKRGTKAKKEENGIRKMVKNLLKSANQHALFVIKDLFIGKSEKQQKLVVQNVIHSYTEKTLDISLRNACSVKNNLQQENVTLQVGTEKHVPMNVSIILKEKILETKPVYSLSIKKFGVYYGNNILLRNCDTAYDAIKLALIDKIFVYMVEKETKNNVIVRSMANKFARQQKALSNRNRNL